MKNKTNNPEFDPYLELKKATLKAWTKMLLNEGIIDLDKCNRMISLIDKITA